MPDTLRPLPAMDELLVEVRKEVPLLAASKHHAPDAPLAGFANTRHRWTMEAGLRYDKDLTESVLAVDKVSLTVSLADLKRKYELSAEHVETIRQVVGTRYDPATGTVTLLRRFRIGNPDIHKASIHLAESLGEQMRTMVAATVGDVRPSLRLLQRFVERRRGEALVAWLLDQPTDTLHTRLSSLEEMQSFLASKSDAVRASLSLIARTKFKHADSFAQAEELAKVQYIRVAQD